MLPDVHNNFTPAAGSLSVTCDPVVSDKARYRPERLKVTSRGGRAHAEETPSAVD